MTVSIPSSYFSSPSLRVKSNNMTSWVSLWGSEIGWWYRYRHPIWPPFSLWGKLYRMMVSLPSSYFTPPRGKSTWNLSKYVIYEIYICVYYIYRFETGFQQNTLMCGLWNELIQTLNKNISSWNRVSVKHLICSLWNMGKFFVYIYEQGFSKTF